MQSRPASENAGAFLFVTAAVVAAIVIAAAYLPDIGRGFVKDDFRWIRDARAAIADPIVSILPHEPGFYRPLVTWTFAFDYTLHGLSARGYGFTNLGLYLACIVAIWWLLREAGVTAAAASIGALAWALNPHGINMAVVWLSGRTSLLLTLCAVLSAIAFLRRWRIAGAILLLAALMSKEEAVVLPAVVLAWLAMLRHGTRRALIVDAIAVTVPLIVYAALRSQTPSLMPSTAPWFYRPTSDLRVLAANALHYLDRGMTFYLVIAVVAWAAYRPRRVPSLPAPLVWAGGAWFVLGYALTVWVPVRSSLYAVFPSVGSALICAAVVDALHRVHDAAGSRDRWMAAALVLLLAFVPMYQSRNDRWVEPARLSERALVAVAADPPKDAGIVVFEDEDAPFASFTDAFGDLAPLAVEQATGRPFEVHIATPDRPWTGPAAARYRLTHGRVDRVE